MGNQSYTNVVVYAVSIIQGEQTTPRGIQISDSIARPSLVTFADVDLDQAEVGGNTFWTAPTTGGAEQVTNYVVYLAADAAGHGRSQIGIVPDGDTDLVVPSNVPVGNFSYIVVYAQSALMEQT